MALIKGKEAGDGLSSRVDYLGPVIVNVNGDRICTDINGVAKFTSGRSRLIVDITDGHFSASDGVLQSGSIAPKKVNGTSNIITSSLDRGAVNVGDVLGQDIGLPQGLERLSNWIIYNVTVDGIPQALEPLESAPDGAVNWKKAKEHIAGLKDQGHVGADLMSEADAVAVFNNLVKEGHNDKAGMDLSGGTPFGKYWLNAVRQDEPGESAVIFMDNCFRRWDKHEGLSRARATQNVLQLMR